jgi:hypothetical protein
MAIKKTPARKTAKPMSNPAPTKKAPAPKSTGYTDDSKITVLVPEPVLRGSRAARWPLVASAKTVGQLRTALGAQKYDTAGTLRWVQGAGLIKLG